MGAMRPTPLLPSPIPRECRDTQRPGKAYVHVCVCGVRITHDEWLLLPFVGVMEGPEEGDWIELRNHECGSTRSVLLEGYR